MFNNFYIFDGESGSVTPPIGGFLNNTKTGTLGYALQTQYIYNSLDCVN
jgi:hypothetical protein